MGALGVYAKISEERKKTLGFKPGCGEQNMITLAPNVYVAKYLLATSKLPRDDAIKILG